MCVALVLLFGAIVYFVMILRGKDWSPIILTIILELAGKKYEYGR